MGAGQQFVDESIDIETKRGGITSKIFILQCRVIFEQSVVHFPETTLCTCCFRGFRCVLRMYVNVGESKIAKDKTHFVAKDLVDRLHQRMCRSAYGTFVIPVFQKRPWCVERTADMIVITNWHAQSVYLDACKTAHCFISFFLFCRFSSAARTPLPPGLTPMGETKLQWMRPSASITKSARSLTPSLLR